MSTIKRRTCTFHVDAHQMVGARLRVDGHFSRVGLQTYTDGMGGSHIEYRSPEEVFARASLDSLQGMAVTVRHPSGGQVTPENWRELAGQGEVVGNTGETVEQDGDHTKGSIWLQDAEAIRQVQSGELVELSVGYTAGVDETPGTTPDGQRYDARQYDIRGNHIALLGGGEARGGPTVRILDAAGHIRLDDPSPSRGRDMQKVTIRIDGHAYTVEVAEDSTFAEAYATAEAQHTDAVKAASDEASELQGKLDTLTEERDELVKQLAAATAPETLAAAAKERAALLDSAAKVAGSAVEDTGDALAVRTAALVARGVDVADKDASYIEGRFDSLLEQRPRTAAERLRGDGTFETTDVVELTDAQRALTTMGGR